MCEHSGIDSIDFKKKTQARADENHHEAIKHDWHIKWVEIAMQKDEHDRRKPDAEIRLDGSAKKNFLAHARAKRIKKDMRE